MAKLSCGCVPDPSGFGWCSECVRKLDEQIWANLSEKDKEYDRHFASSASDQLDYTIDTYESGDYEGCSCHINPPCSYCMTKEE